LPLSRYAGGFDWLSSQPIKMAGWSLLVIALAWIVVAQHHMGESWRIGLPDAGSSAQTPALVTHGVFARSRNPIFLGMAASLAGLFLVLPNALTLLAAILGIVLMQIRIRIDEPYLSARFGSAYTDYTAKVCRWL
jgi:protein-S-isoprenylcysteine O-methyltransferase Ste14